MINVSAHGYLRILELARTIEDLATREYIQSPHLTEGMPIEI